MNHSKKREKIPVLKLTTKIRKKNLQTVSILTRTCINLFYEKTYYLNEIILNTSLLLHNYQLNLSISLKWRKIQIGYCKNKE